ncbi:efflux RND transporter permease subunit [Limibacter armeniacum]|uniref:efflux RND transporter permease subunit n=1 Tax=Limibacter armeniacum TaxID=466084 RepID=UPI002FE5B726
MRIVKGSMKYHQVTLVFTILALLAGVYALLEMPRRENPAMEIPQALVVSYYPGANNLQVEEQVTHKIEEYLFSFEEVRKEKTYSTSTEGRVIIVVELQKWVKDTDLFWSKLQHGLNVLYKTSLPSEATSPVVDSDFGDTVALLIAISSDSLDQTQLRQYVRLVEDALRELPQTSKIKRHGEQEEAIFVTSTSQQLVQYSGKDGLKIEDIIKVIRSQNTVQYAGELNIGEITLPLHTTNFYASEVELGNQQIFITPQGETVRLKDVANIKRGFKDPTYQVRVNDTNTILIAIEMQEGFNIVEFGDDVRAKVSEAESLFPTGVSTNIIVDQPTVVKESVNHFVREFFIAIVSVIIVTMLLLPFSVASIAAMAIPVTVALTFAALNFAGIELHQVSLAGLIIVLGMVVDDAIVIADNYVEKLDEGLSRWEAGWRSASDMFIPVLTATLTIIASFLPMSFLSGIVGEFIYSLPLAVAIALFSSFMVAMLLTPYLCYTFIKKGLSEGKGEDKPKRFSPLDAMQSGYDSIIDWAFKRPKTIVLLAILVVMLGGSFKLFVKEKFFPAAERNQFVVELTLPEGSSFSKTDQAVKKIEKALSAEDDVTSYASFIGGSAPRFYYNLEPEVPADNFAQLMVNTISEEATSTLSEKLSSQLSNDVPEGNIEVKILQQGMPLKSQVEVRISGNNIQRLKQLGEQVVEIMKNTSGSKRVRTNFRDDLLSLKIDIQDEVANQLGITRGVVGMYTAIGFRGYPVTELWENETPVDVIFRLEKTSRNTFEDVSDLYVASPVTGGVVPLRAIANLEPEWQTGRIVHRNGLRTITIGCETEGALPADVLASIRPDVEKIQLPKGYKMTYGGEYESQEETFSEMVVALSISLILIFVILLFQFRNIAETLIVMAAIPLSLLGAFTGLILTGNPFGFTSFLGLISLSGVVVRNSIILVDHADELVRDHGMSTKEAALEAGKRRLRPIFLTTMAAAVGVLPMIISGSPLWSPLASVIAVGLIFSMFMTLIAVPILYMLFIKNEPADTSSIPTQTQ